MAPPKASSRLSRRKNHAAHRPLPENPLWYKDAIFYELHVRAFYDSNGDGIGDFAGLMSKIGYLRDLGITAIWLLPFYPSPLRDGGYDIADYTGINPEYGTLGEFKRFLNTAHDHGIRVITELVLNHTSSDHAWFQRARRAPPGSRWRNFYVWSDTPHRYTDARIIFKDFETSNWAWDPLAQAYYWHRFYSHQPDLNFDNPEVQKALFKVVEFWFDLGVDGMRLDAVPYLYERDGTNCENLPETHAFLRALRAHIDNRYRDRMLLAEANQWPEDAAAYFGSGDECHMNFHFPLMPRMFMAVHLEDRFPIVDILRQTPSIHASCQWATFLRNHDELTLEMVTDEDRDYMYRVYAEDPEARINLGIRRRLAPLLRVRRKIELMNALLFSLPGTPVLYYGDEIGMGDNIYLGDRDAVRTPMQWSADRNAGFSGANPQRLYLPINIDPEYHYEAFNVHAQQSNPSSLLWWTKRLIALRKQFPVFGFGKLEFVTSENRKVLAFVREHEQQRVLVAANLSRFPQYAEFDLGAYENLIPVEMFGRTRFPAITHRPYFLSFGPHAFYWFVLETPSQATLTARTLEPPLLDVLGHWRNIVYANGGARLEPVLLNYITARKWFHSKARVPKRAAIVDVIRLGAGPDDAMLLLCRIDYVEGEAEVYLLGLSLATGAQASELEQHRRHAILARLRITPEDTSAAQAVVDGVLVDALATGEAAKPLLAGMRRRLTFGGDTGQVHAMSLRMFKVLGSGRSLAPRAAEFEQTNTTVVLGDTLLLKVYRKVEAGANPELELGRFLTEHAAQGLVPRMAGAFNYKRHGREPAVLATVQEYIANEGTAWHLTLSVLERYCERVLTKENGRPPQLPTHDLWELGRHELPGPTLALLGDFVAQIRLLGKRTGELHLALRQPSKDEAFVATPFSGLHQQSLYQGAHALLGRTFDLLRNCHHKLDENLAQLVARALDREAALDASLHEIVGRKIEVLRIRCHNDFHLGQVLFTGSDFVIIDFEGDPARPLSERNYKRCPLRDVAGMLRSFSYAAGSTLLGGKLRPDDAEKLRPWMALWYTSLSAAYLAAYLQTVGDAAFVPANPADRALLLRFYLQEKCIHELGYELTDRPEWIGIPLRGLLDLLPPG